MTFLYRFALTVTRRQPYIDWANSVDDDGPELTEDWIMIAAPFTSFPRQSLNRMSRA
jgi:hypothetical protein